MTCLACRGFSDDSLCRRCRLNLRRAIDRRVEAGVHVRSGFAHEGPARLLVHRLKYEGVIAAADVLAEPLVEFAAGADTLVPVPRMAIRRWRYGVDPAAVLASTLSRWTGVPIVHGLRAPVFGGHQAGLARADRRVPVFRLRSPVPGRVLLVDDVVTTGATLGAAARTLGDWETQVMGAVCATTSEGMKSGSPQVDVLASRSIEID